MQLRVLFSIFNIAVFIFLFVLEFTLVAYANLIFYALIVWFIVSFLLLRARFMSRQIGGPTPAPAPPLPGTPLPSATPAGGTGIDATEIGFCPHCGTNVAPGTAVCPSCGRSTHIG